jgi:hypothetical protein
VFVCLFRAANETATRCAQTRQSGQRLVDGATSGHQNAVTEHKTKEYSAVHNCRTNTKDRRNNEKMHFVFAFGAKLNEFMLTETLFLKKRLKRDTSELLRLNSLSH